LRVHPSITADRIYALCMRRLRDLDDTGVCLACGEEQFGCKPDARQYKCENCGRNTIFGPEEVLISGWYYLDDKEGDGKTKAHNDE